MARFLKRFELTKEHNGIKPFSLEFTDGLNLIIGENGSGKSTMLELITSFPKSKDRIKVESDKVDYRFLDCEMQNPRTKEKFSSSNIGFQAMSHFMSHGETMFPLVSAMEKMEDIVVFIDEPESGLSLSKQAELPIVFEKAIANRCQIIVATHSYPVIKSVPIAFSMDSKEWVSSEAYLEELGLFYSYDNNDW